MFFTEGGNESEIKVIYTINSHVIVNNRLWQGLV